MKPLFYAGALGAAILLAGCGGSGDHGSAGPVAPPAQPPASAVDSFVAAVLSVFGKSEEGEPAPIDATAVTSPEGSEPQPVQ
ncbi:hypothetical protein [Pseudoduganella armeniaca]|uniref:Lipoprotein n=1 Tax=Pseudoduganella armeniaca TaxID=2072590 RepID=A0A2R4C6F5_9BURK|nr:hypothetical protein [Pseudoduganella armeniaca]AVR95203.1 hypothetical protein C9I28_05295 [Pseudoduganella armeniaca]